MITTANRLHSVSEYYFSRKLKEVRQLMQDGKPIVNMGIGSPDGVPSEKVMLAIQKALFDVKAHEYQNYQGLPELRTEMANFYRTQFDVVLQPETEILPLMGSKEGIMHISMAFLNPGDVALIPNPGYPTYESVTNLVGAKAMFYDLKEENNWEPNWEALEKQDLSKVKIMWVSYPHMPTGAKGNLALLERLVQFAKKHQILVVNDNPYSFVLNDNPLSLLQIEGAIEVVLELNSLSKTYNMAGWRVGMVSGHASLIAAILKVKSNMDSGMFYGIQKGAIEALKLGKEWFQELNQKYTQRRALVFQLATLLGCSYQTDSVGLFVWAKIPPTEKSSEAFVDAILQNHDLFVVPGTIFGSNGEGYIRFSLCVPEEKIKEIINKIEKELPLQ